MTSHVTLQYATCCKQDPFHQRISRYFGQPSKHCYLCALIFWLEILQSAVVCDGVVKDSNVINVLLCGVIHIKVIHSTGTCCHGNTAGFLLGLLGGGGTPLIVLHLTASEFNSICIVVLHCSLDPVSYPGSFLCTVIRYKASLEHRQLLDAERKDSFNGLFHFWSWCTNQIASLKCTQCLPQTSQEREGGGEGEEGGGYDHIKEINAFRWTTSKSKDFRPGMGGYPLLVETGHIHHTFNAALVRCECDINYCVLWEENGAGHWPDHSVLSIPLLQRCLGTLGAH